eukprot:TRINITY_DN3480_c0_g1_i3.p1 TRINITY_DN3480_c0_g1~~TRINITY_DN3480_c0_g1_i3.p1  ORF type:complete len:130 (+),score=13.14 TRINITY_DN3480_c0_g1_i3:120-509(+)
MRKKRTFNSHKEKDKTQPPPASKVVSDFEVDGNERGTLRYNRMDSSRLEDFLPVKPEEGPYVINTFTKPASAKEIFHDHPEWEGAPVSHEDVKWNLERIKKMAAFESLDFDAIVSRQFLHLILEQFDVV